MAWMWPELLNLKFVWIERIECSEIGHLASYMAGYYQMTDLGLDDYVCFNFVLEDMILISKNFVWNLCLTTYS